MTLLTNRETLAMPVAAELQRYLEDTLHEPARIVALERAPSLPSFLSRMYSLLEGHIAGQPCIFLATIDNTATPSDIAKHVDLVRSAVDGIVVFVTPWLSAHNRSRLIGQGVPFVVPGKQLYIPDLARDLRDLRDPQSADRGLARRRRVHNRGSALAISDMRARGPANAAIAANRARLRPLTPDPKDAVSSRDLLLMLTTNAVNGSI